MRTKLFLMILLGTLAFAIGACGTVTPTPIPQPTPPPVVITVVITATPLPATATPIPLPPTLAPITPTVALVQPTATRAVAAATKPPAVATKPPAASPTTQLAIKYPTASLIEPIWTDNQKDERKFPSQALIFKWKAVAGLQGDECYRVDIAFRPDNPGAGSPTPRGDYFLTNCGNSTQIDFPVQFQLNQPSRPGPNYGGLMIDSSAIWVDWSVTIVKKTGPCVDDYHCPNAPVSQPGKGYFILRGG